MADPITWALIGIGIDMAATIGGGVMGSISASQEAENMESMRKYEQDQAQRARIAAEQEAVALERETTEKERIQRERNERMLALNRARLGATGLDYSGTPLLVEIETAKDMELDVANMRRQSDDDAAMIRYQGSVNANNHLMQAKQYGFRAKQYGISSVTTMIGAGMGALGDIAKGGAAYYGDLEKKTAKKSGTQVKTYGGFSYEEGVR